MTGKRTTNVKSQTRGFANARGEEIEELGLELRAVEGDERQESCERSDI